MKALVSLSVLNSNNKRLSQLMHLLVMHLPVTFTRRTVPRVERVQSTVPKR